MAGPTPRSAAGRVLERGRAGLARLLGATRPAPGDAGAPAPGAADDLYGGAYFGEGRADSGDREGRSGYASYDRISSNADIAAYLLWRNFAVESVLDVGCATGFLVEALRDLGVAAEGCDASAYAVGHATPGARDHVVQADPLAGLPYADASFDLVSGLEVLEHLPPDAVARAVAELARVTRALVYVTIPSFGPNASGPDGHFEGKVRPERLAHYASLGPDYPGPVPAEDLARDAEGQPIEGHLTIASFGWWTARFAEAGLERWVDVERRLYADLAPAGLAPFWNLYVFARPGTPRTIAAAREPGRSLRDLGLVHPLTEHAHAQAAGGEEPGA